MRTIGTFPVESVICRGFASTLYRSTADDGNPVAIKVMDNLRVLDSLPFHFFDNLRKLRDVPQNGVIQILAVETEDNQPYTVMPYLKGEDLQSLWARQIVLMDEIKIHFIGEIVSALSNLHKLGIVHGNLKPSNLHLIESGSVIVMEPGRFPIVGEEANLFVSPEVMKGCEQTFLSDIWSIGAIIYWMATGAIPGTTQESLIWYPGLFSDKLKPIAEKSLSFTPKCRASIEELKNEIEEIIHDITQIRHDEFNLMRSALSLYESEKYEEAVTRFEEIVALYPENENARSYMMRCYRKLESGRRMGELIDRAKSFLKDDLLDEAEDILKECLAIDPEDTKITGLAALIESKKYGVTENILPSEDKDARVVNDLIEEGVSYFKVGQIRMAMESWEKALKIDGKNMIVRDNITLAKAELFGGGAPHSISYGTKKRRYPRANVSYNAEIFLLHLPEKGAIPSIIVELSYGGCAITTPSPLFPTTLVNIVIKGVDGEEMKIDGQVVRCSKVDGEDNLYRTGVRLIHIDDATREKLFKQIALELNSAK